MSEEKRYSFIADYFDPQANIIRQYQLSFFPFDNSIELHDIKTRRLFLKRVKYPHLSLKELFVGASVTIYSRVLNLVDFGDEITRKQFSKNEEALVLIIGDGMLQCGNIIHLLYQLEMRLINIRMSDAIEKLSLFGIKERFIAVHIAGSNIESKANDIRNKFNGVQIVSNTVQLSDLMPEIFNNKTTATLKNCAVCVIKPHAICSGHGGLILQRIFDEGFVVSAIASFNLSTADAEDFLEVYKGVVPEYKKLVDHLSSSTCWALEVRAENAVSALRAVCGPHDPEICRILYPHTIRSIYGIDRIFNVVHCTDLVEDGPLESEFFFQLMLNKP